MTGLKQGRNVVTLLIVGLVMFLGIHLLPAFVPFRNGLVEKMGENAYKGMFTLISVAGLVLIVWGFSRAPFVPVYVPPTWGRTVAMVLMPLSLILFAAANMPGHIRHKLKHPMLIGTFLFAVSHLVVNGDLRSVMLFGCFGVYAVVDMASELARGKTLIGDKPPALSKDIMAVVGGLVIAAVLAYFHGRLFGVAIIY